MNTSWVWFLIILGGEGAFAEAGGGVPHLVKDGQRFRSLNGSSFVCVLVCTLVCARKNERCSCIECLNWAALRWITGSKRYLSFGCQTFLETATGKTSLEGRFERLPCGGVMILSRLRRWAALEQSYFYDALEMVVLQFATQENKPAY